MRLYKLLFATVVVSFVFSGTALAQEGSEYEEETVYTFEGSVVQGELVRPDGEAISGQIREGANLIRIRMDFIPEMVRSVEDL